ncbi:MAG: DUF4870 domain-containing protein [Chitinophagaceae bacterium]|nr:DUF4870 domain-containing protein [Chitinophagaceae bacterium]
MDKQKSYLGTEELPATTPTSDEKTLAILAHILTLVAWFIAPLVIYLIKKDESPFVAAHAKESLNFQITVGLICIGLIITIIGALLLWIVGILALILIIVATIKANDGKLYRYPVNWRLIK